MATASQLESVLIKKLADVFGRDRIRRSLDTEDGTIDVLVQDHSDTNYAVDLSFEEEETFDARRVADSFAGLINSASAFHDYGHRLEVVLLLVVRSDWARFPDFSLEEIARHIKADNVHIRTHTGYGRPSGEPLRILLTNGKYNERIVALREERFNGIEPDELASAVITTPE